MDGWSEIFSTTSSALASMKKHVLEEEGVSVILLNQKDSLYNNFGEIKIYVKAEDSIKALRIIREGE